VAMTSHMTASRPANRGRESAQAHHMGRSGSGPGRTVAERRTASKKGTTIAS
jgi:hypothetical protein